ncbi:MAG: hypothetical protein MZW92_74725 [Comamonadaceae bacterium]|nr:hypothetical protein [Comamonadaceae bacterium]
MLWSTHLPEAFKRFCVEGRDRHQLAAVRERRPDAAVAGATTTASPAASRRCASASRCSSSARAPTWPSALLYAINGGRDEVSGEQVGPAYRAGRRATCSTTTTSIAKFDDDDGLAGAAPTCNAHERASTTCTTSTTTSGSRWRCTTATSCARWPSASPACRSSPTACRRSSTRRSTSSATRRGLVDGLPRSTGEFPAFGNNDDRVDDIAAGLVETLHGQAARAPDLPRRDATRSRC